MAQPHPHGRATDQEPTLAFLSSPRAYEGAPSPVRRIDTSISAVFLAGDRAYKLKRAVRLPFLDFSTVERRRLACEREVRINRRAAPGLYLGAVPVVRGEDGALALGGDGDAVDWVVVMRRFEQTALLDAVATRGGLTGDLTRRLADAVVRLHLAAPPTPGQGGAGAMRDIVDGNIRRLLETASDGHLDRDAILRLDRLTRERLGFLAAEIDARRRDGFVRHGHGDLHLRNIVLLEGEPTPFDAIEFSPEIACCDVLYDLAFLLMDLAHRGLVPAANAVMNRYIDLTADPGVRLLPPFMSIRAAIRAHVTAASVSLLGPDARRAATEEAAGYLALAEALLRAPEPFVLAVGGLSGSGKSSVAAALAPRFLPPPGARVLRTDVLRKRLEGVLPEVRLPASSYSRSRSAEVYAELVRQAVETAAGYPVVVDGVFAARSDRDAIEGAAKAAGLPFLGLWLDAPPALLRARVASRTGDASDATPVVVENQVRECRAPSSWTRIDAAPSLPEVERSAASALASALVGSTRA